MGLFTPDDRERAAELAEQAERKPRRTATAVVEENLLAADAHEARLDAARALADAAERDPEAVVPHADVLRDRLADEPDVATAAERALEAVAAHHRERAERALDRAEGRCDAGEYDRAADALDSARSRFEHASDVFADAPGSDPVLAESLGVETVDDEGAALFSPLLEQGEPLPASADWRFTTGTDGQQSVRMRVRRAPGAVSAGRPLADTDEVVAELHLANLPPAPAGVPVLEVGVDVDADGAVTARLRDHGSGRRVEERAGTAAVEGDAPAAADAGPVPAAQAERVERLAERIETGRAAEAVPPAEADPVDQGDEGTAEPVGDQATDDEPAGDEGTRDDQGSSADPIAVPPTDATDDGDAAASEDPEAASDSTDGATPVGPGKRTTPAARGAQAAGAGEAVDGPSERVVELLLDVRDDLTRALGAETDDADVIRTGVEMTDRKLDRFDGDGDGAVTAVADALAPVLDAAESTGAAVRERAADARDRVDDVLADAGIAVVDPDPGEPLDANRHRVLDTVDADHPPGVVVDVERTGYERDDTVRRPATVRVSADDAGSAEPTPASGSGSTTAADEAEPMPPGTGEPTSAGDPEPASTGDPRPTSGWGAKPASGGGTDGFPVPDAVPGVPRLDVEHGALRGREVLSRSGDTDRYRATVEAGGETHEVAVAELQPTGGDDDRFEAAIEQWARIDDHERVLDVVAWGTDPVPWVAAEYVPVGSLADREPPMDLPQAVWTAGEVADAVVHAHRNGVGHFDLKPSTVLLREVPDAWAAPLVGDWGLGRIVLERADRVRGSTPRYAAPEQLVDCYGTPGPAADVYAVGAITYELVAGRPPFTGRLDRVVDAVVASDAPPLQELNPDVPERLAAVVERSMAVDPADRHDDALALREALRGVLDDLR